MVSNNSSLNSLSSNNSSDENQPQSYAGTTTNPPRLRQPLSRRLSSAASNIFTFGNERDDNVGNVDDVSRKEDESLIQDVANDYFNANDTHYVLGADSPHDFQEDEEYDDEKKRGDEDVIPRSKELESVHSYQPELYSEPQEETTEPKATRIASQPQKPRKYKLWDEEFRADRIQIGLKLLSNYVFLLIGFAGALLFYWASYYQRSTRYKHLKMAIVIADRQVGQLPNIVGKTIESYFTDVPTLQQLGKFEIWDYDKVSSLAAEHGHNITQEVYQQVHHAKVWAAFYVYENATLMWNQALSSASTQFDPTHSLMEVVYETGRDFNAVSNYIITIIQQIVRSYPNFATQSEIVANMLQTVNQTQALNVMSQAPQLVSTIPTFRINDLHPVTNPVFQAPFQIGLIYLVVFGFFQFIFTVKIHMYLATKIKGWSYIFFRILSSQVAYMAISLGMVVLNTAFQLPFNTVFGYSGFLVIWMFCYLLMASLGSIIEVIVIIMFSIKPQLIGFVLLFTAVINLAPIISPPVLTPPFYYYGYAVPSRNAYELLHVAYFDAYKGHMGRNIGVLLAWIVASNVVMPFMLKFLAKKKKEADAKQAMQAGG
ncbi:hypothetical protein CANMA_000739 [Candida margitis]|uniref:uncharacterized protein n=1 Tax=Candida margitis TaxID=1775924 RepID=UPI0022278B16|nr:uncharacterized protein CANMA_000739 [Candida margitis]KAI5970128.1 hypothetical protein CANMA_000739 [Candida margitis]